jgi:hypothetical protein
MTQPNGFAIFMARPFGRLLRIVLGVAIIAWARTLAPGGARAVWTAIGIVPILAGVLNVCLIAPLIGAPFSGRAALRR